MIVPISGGIVSNGTNANVASLVNQFLDFSPQSFPQTKATLVAYEVPLQSIAEALMQTIQKHAPECSERAKAFISDIESSTHSDRYGNAGKNVRELLRLLYYEFAPDDFVKKWAEVKIENKRPTRMSRLRFGPFGMYPVASYEEDFVTSVEVVCTRLSKGYDDLNQITHSTGTSDALNARPLLHSVISDILTWIELVERGRELRMMHVQDLFQEQLEGSGLDDLIPHLEEHYSHISDLDPMTEECQVVRETAESIEVEGSGSIGFVTQIGSNSDVRNGDGLVGRSSRSFEFRCSMKWDDLTTVDVGEEDIVLVPDDRE
jgi:hypothetical protein